MKSCGPVYDRIGAGYTALRRPDPRIASAIEAALGGAQSVVNVGAGAGSYEPAATVAAVEPSPVMIAQRPEGAARAVQASAEAIPLPDGCAEAAMAILTVHHWHDVGRGIDEMRRIARRRLVVLTWDPDAARDFWLVRDYLPELWEWDARRVPSLAALGKLLGGPKVVPVPIPQDCTDGFLGAYWRRPWAYLDPAVRARISGFSSPDAPPAAAGLARLADDLASGVWRERNRTLLEREELDVGYRILVAEL